MIIISKTPPPSFAGTPAQWLQDIISTQVRMSINIDVRKEFSKIALIDECESRLTSGKEHVLIQAYTLVDHDYENCKVVELLNGNYININQSEVVRISPATMDTINIHLQVSMFKKRIEIETDSKLRLYFVLGVKDTDYQNSFG